MQKSCFLSLIFAFLASKSHGLSPVVGSSSQPRLRSADFAASPSTRRSLLTTLVGSCSISLLTSPLAAVGESAEVRGTKVTPFNSLAFQYRGSDFNGLDESSLPVGQPSVSYSEFMEKLKAGNVERVDFQAPDGDVAYCFFKDQPSSSIRIGSGYPIEQHDGYSSPLFAIRAVQNAGVPYKFVVPALAKVNK
jgi:hypothetical protein